jgi:hypothetical protein
MNEGQVLAALARRHRPPAWAFLEQVRNSTGWAGNRTADAIALSLWPSRGLHLHGFEVKTHRSDWLRELRQPDKTEEGVCRYCHFWWIAASEGVIFHDQDDVPESWGVYEIRKGRVYTIKKAPQLSPEPPDVGFVAAVLRKVTEATVPTSAVDEIVRERVEAERDRWTKGSARRAEDTERTLERLREQVMEFQDAAGFTEQKLTIMNLYGWRKRPKEIGAAVKLVLDGGLDGKRDELTRTRDRFQQISDELTALLDVDKL